MLLGFGNIDTLILFIQSALKNLVKSRVRIAMTRPLINILRKVIYVMKHMIFDFGNVLARFYPEELTAAAVPEKVVANAVCDIVFDRLYWDKLDDGSMREEDIKDAIRSRVAPEHYAAACAVIDGWVKNLVPVDGMPQLIADVKARGSQIYLLSNISPCFADEYKKNPWIAQLFTLFDGLVFSGSVGLTKPHKDIYLHLLDRYNLKAEECIFVDDNVKNVETANILGIKGILFDGDVEHLRSMLL